MFSIVKLFFIPVFLFTLIACNTPEVEKVVSPTKEEHMVTAKEKGGMILLTDRPANLETPLHYFLQDYTPNDVFFVRWHLSQLPEKIDADTFRLRISGNIKTTLTLSLTDLKTKFKPFSITALACCAGNARSFLDPRVPGGQWKNGAMGNAKWKGVRLKDILEMAGLKDGSQEVSFNGLDAPPLPTVPDFVKSIPLNRAMDGDVMIAYEMNDQSIPLLNGYPLKVVVPGWYATYWVGMLSEIRVYKEPYKGFWMNKAYLVPKGVINGNEKPDSLSTDLTPISKIDVRSIFVSPEPDSLIKSGTQCEIQGLAFDGGDGITKVELSTDNGTSWKETRLDADLGNYSWRRWRYMWLAGNKGEYHLKVKATNSKGQTQPEHHWNRSGYMRNEIESLTVKVE